MRIEQLKYFLEVARTGSITAAADNLFISQQSLCTSLNRLEKEIGLKLFHRTKRGTTLTEDGQILGVYIADILDSYHRFENILGERQQKEQAKLTGSLTLCVSPLLAEAILPDLIRLIHQHYPQINLGFVELSTSQIISYTATAPSHLGLFLTNEENALALLPTLAESLDFQSLLTDQMVACVSATSAYSLLEEFSGQDFTTAARINFSMELPGIDSPQAAKDSRVFSSNNIKLHQKLISENTAIGSVPSLLFSAIFPGNTIVSVPIVPPITVETILVSDHEQLSPEAQAAILLIQTYLQELSTGAEALAHLPPKNHATEQT